LNFFFFKKSQHSLYKSNQK